MDWNAIAQRLQTRPPFPLGQGQSSAVLALIAGDRLILEVRSQALRHQPGEICLPGGRMEPGESPMHAALRETREELGIDPQGIQMVGSLAVLLHADRRAVFPVLAHCAPSVLESLQPNPAEVEEVFTIPLDWFRANPPQHYQYQQVYTGLEQVPPQMARWLSGYPTLRQGQYWDYEGKLIWGLTARTIAQVLEVTGFAQLPHPNEPALR